MAPDNPETSCLSPSTGLHSVRAELRPEFAPPCPKCGGTEMRWNNARDWWYCPSCNSGTPAEPLRRVGPDVRAELERLRGLSEGQSTPGGLLGTASEAGCPSESAALSESGDSERSQSAEGSHGDSTAPTVTVSPDSLSAAHIAEARRDAQDLLQIGEEISRILGELDRAPFGPPFVPGREDFIRAYDYRALKHTQLAGLYREKARVLRKINSEGGEA